ncbi:MAG: hypothetical protein OTJ97_11330, partial [SAR202 cluster bacterium]|nr:hypothetical protein [SAR202 cluster bacterium]
AKVSSFLNIIDNGGDVIRCHQLGGRGYINLTAESYPAHDLKVWDLIENKKYDEAKVLMDSVDAPLRDFYNKISARSGGQGRLKKGLMALMGQPVGSSRPPSKPMNDEEMDGLREVLEGIGWPVASRAEVAAAK